MEDRMNRRSFLKQSAILGASSVVGGSLLSDVIGKTSKSIFSNDGVEIAVIEGADYFNNTIQSVELLGGMGNFMMKGARVGLLVNSPWANPGTYTNPDVALAVVKMCFDAGAKEIYSVEDASRKYWDRSGLAEKFADQIENLKPAGENVKVDIPRGKKLKEAVVSKALLECDVLIDVPIVKDHTGTHFTCTMKNMMGACLHNPTCRFMHLGSGAKDFYDDVEHLSQCIADLNLVRKPDLCIVDATEFVITGGPRGPGEIKKAQKVVAGVDPVAVDAYCAEILGLKREDVLMVKMAHEHGLGEIDPSKVQVKTAKA